MKCKILGKGSYGTVFTKDDKYAIKQTAFDEISWVNEILITNYLDCKNVINFLNIALVNGTNFRSSKNENNIHIKMNRYVCLRDLKIMDDRDIILIMRDIANALAYCKKKKILHRDVKECNILLEYDNSKLRRAYLTDFGLAISNTIEIKLSSNVVTATHRPPEVIEKKTYDSRVDTWGFGMMVVFLITGCYLMEELKYNQKQFTKFVLNQDEFIHVLHKFVNNNIHKSIRHAKFYFDIINKCLKLHDSRALMDDISKNINMYIICNKLELPILIVPSNISLYKIPLLNIKEIITGNFTPRIFNTKKWMLMEKKIILVNPLYVKLISLTRVLVYFKEREIFIISPSTTYSFASVFLILESVLLDTFLPLHTLKNNISPEISVNLKILLNNMFKILKLFNFDMMELIHHCIDELIKITKKSPRKRKDRILFFRLGNLWGY